MIGLAAAVLVAAACSTDSSPIPVTPTDSSGEGATVSPITGATPTATAATPTAGATPTATPERAVLRETALWCVDA